MHVQARQQTNQELEFLIKQAQLEKAETLRMLAEDFQILERKKVRDKQGSRQGSSC